MGQHRHLWLAWISDANQDRLPLSRLNSCCADRFGFSIVSRPSTAGRYEGSAGMAFLLLQVSANRSRPVPRARCLHSTDEVEKHFAPSARRGFDYPPGPRVLRLAFWQLALQRRFWSGACMKRYAPNILSVSPVTAWVQLFVIKFLTGIVRQPMTLTIRI